jgi:hypothetical protein
MEQKERPNAQKLCPLAQVAYYQKRPSLPRISCPYPSFTLSDRCPHLKIDSTPHLSSPASLSHCAEVGTARASDFPADVFPTFWHAGILRGELPTLPFEPERETFRQCALTYPDTARGLVFVARRVYIW